MESTKSLKLGLIGAGNWGKNLVRDYYKIGFLDIICDSNEELLHFYKQQYPNLRVTNNWQDLLSDPEITAICVSLPAKLHYQFAKEALLADKDVYVEKPITLNVNEAEELVKLANERQKILMVGHILHYHPAVQKIKEIIASGEIGQIVSIISNRFNLGTFRTYENVLWSFAPHDISVILSLCHDQMPTWVKCTGQPNLINDVHDITNSILKFESRREIYVNINVSWLHPYKEQKMIIIGENGMIVFDDTSVNRKIELYKNYVKWSQNMTPEPIANKPEPLIIPVDTAKSPLEQECQYFMNCCLNRTDPLTNGTEGVRVLKVLDALTMSLKEHGQTIYFDQKFFTHGTACVEHGAIIGPGTKIWHFSHICPGATIGSNCNIGQNVFVAGGAKIGNHCKVQNNVSIYAGVVAEDYVFFGPSCVLTNDKNPRGMYSKNGAYLTTYLETGVTLGANCTVVCGIRIGKHSLIGAGAVVTKDVEPYSIMVGNPAKRIGTIDEFGNRTLFKKDNKLNN